MGKITIEITDLENGNVGIRRSPQPSEVDDMIAKSGDDVKASLIYAQACNMAISFLHKEIGNANSGLAKGEARENSRLILPAYNNLINFFKKQ